MNTSAKRLSIILLYSIVFGIVHSSAYAQISGETIKQSMRQLGSVGRLEDITSLKENISVKTPKGVFSGQHYWKKGKGHLWIIKNEDLTYYYAIYPNGCYANYPVAAKIPLNKEQEGQRYAELFPGLSDLPKTEQKPKLQTDLQGTTYEAQHAGSLEVSGNQCEIIDIFIQGRQDQLLCRYFVYLPELMTSRIQYSQIKMDQDPLQLTMLEYKTEKSGYKWPSKMEHPLGEMYILDAEFNIKLEDKLFVLP